MNEKDDMRIEWNSLTDEQIRTAKGIVVVDMEDGNRSEILLTGVSAYKNPGDPSDEVMPLEILIDSNDPSQRADVVERIKRIRRIHIAK